VMRYKEIIKQLDELHSMRRKMSHYSNHQGIYEQKAITLNTELEELTGFSYVEHKSKETIDGLVNRDLEYSLIPAREEA
jgi:hypothetical protein